MIFRALGLYSYIIICLGLINAFNVSEVETNEKETKSTVSEPPLLQNFCILSVYTSGERVH